MCAEAPVLTTTTSFATHARLSVLQFCELGLTIVVWITVVKEVAVNEASLCWSRFRTHTWVRPKKFVPLTVKLCPGATPPWSVKVAFTLTASLMETEHDRPEQLAPAQPGPLNPGPGVAVNPTPAP